MSVFLQKPPPPAPQSTDPSNPSAAADMANNQVVLIRALEDTQMVVDGMYTYLDKYPPTPLPVTDAATGRQYFVLGMDAGTVAAIVAGRAFLVTDESAGGTDGLISVTAGSVTDLTNSGTVWTGISGNIIYMNDPVAGNVPYALPLTGPPVRQPYLQLDPGATCCYLNATVDPATGFITAMEIDADTGSGLPASTSTNWYQLLTSLTVTITSGVAKVTCANDGAQSSLYYRICGLLPLTDGSQYNVGT